MMEVRGDKLFVFKNLTLASVNWPAVKYIHSAIYFMMFLGRVIFFFFLQFGTFLSINSFHSHTLLVPKIGQYLNGSLAEGKPFYW